jgi:peroxin-1
LLLPDLREVQPHLTLYTQILRTVSKKIRLTDDVSLDEVAKWCQYYTGADLQALLYNAQLQAIHDLIDADEDGPPLGKHPREY